MTLVEIDLVLPNGNPLVNAPFTILPSKADFTDSLTGVVMPRLMELTTDALGKASVSLWPNEVPYFLEAVDSESEAVIFYKFIVPVVAPNTSVRLQDIVAEGEISDTYYDEEAIAIIHAAKLSSKASELAAIAAAATAVAAANSVTDISEEVEEVRALAAQALASRNTAVSSASTASTAASTATAGASTATSQAVLADASADAAEASAIAAAASAASATSSEAAALASRNQASGFATTASTGASTATTKAGEADASAIASAASAAVAAGHAQNIGNLIGNPVSSVNGRSGAVVIGSSDITTGLGYTPYNPANTLGTGALSGTYNISISGTAAVATAAVGLQTARTLTLGATGKAFDGTANVTWTLAEMGIDSELPALLKTVNGFSLAGSGNVDVGGAVNGILKSNGSGAYSAAVAGTDYVAPSGSITGNASTANRLTTPRNINGVPFDGSADITMPMLGSWWGEPISLTVANNNAVLTKNRTYHLNSQGGAFLVNLPTLLPGDWVKLVDVGYALASNNVTIGRAGQLIRNAALNLILDVSGDSVELVGTSTGVIEQ